MSFETGAPPPPPPDPGVPTVQIVPDPTHPPVARPAAGHDATTSILPGPPPGTTTYRLRATETTATD